MTITDVLESMQFMVDQSGKPTAAVVDMPAWEAFVQALEEIEDNQLARERLRTWRSKVGVDSLGLGGFRAADHKGWTIDSTFAVKSQLPYAR